MITWENNYNNPKNFLHATHEIVVKYTCPNINEEIEIRTTKYEADRDIVWFEQYREFIHKAVPSGTLRVVLNQCKCGNPHIIIVDDYKLTGLTEALSMTSEEWEKKYE